MAVDVRWATTGDAAALAAMLCEMAVHYRQPPIDADRALSASQKWLDQESPAYPHFALAFAEGEICGLAS
ncbi:MAG: GNAT family N-acetyltransferase, partial [Mesorhizobium sp.]